MQNQYNKKSEDDIIVLTNREGVDISFHSIAGVLYQDDYYVILQPTLEAKETEEDALVYKVMDCMVNKNTFELIEDKKIILAIFYEYEKNLHLNNC